MDFRRRDRTKRTLRRNDGPSPLRTQGARPGPFPCSRVPPRPGRPEPASLGRAATPAPSPPPRPPARTADRRGRGRTAPNSPRLPQRPRVPGVPGAPGQQPLHPVGGDLCPGQPERGDVLPDRPDCPGVRLHKERASGPPGERLQPERARARVEVEHPAPLQRADQRPHGGEDPLPGPVTRGAGPPPRRHGQPPPPCASRDDSAHPAILSVPPGNRFPGGKSPGGAHVARRVATHHITAGQKGPDR